VLAGGAVANATDFVFNAPAHSAFFTLSLHDALPICLCSSGEILRPDAARPRGGARLGSTAPTCRSVRDPRHRGAGPAPGTWWRQDRKSTRLNSSHVSTSYAVFCLKKKKIP